jgi:hypothetical protein
MIMNYNVCLFIIFWLFLESGQFEIVLTKPSCFTFALSMEVKFKKKNNTSLKKLAYLVNIQNNFLNYNTS